MSIGSTWCSLNLEQHPKVCTIWEAMLYNDSASSFTRRDKGRQQPKQGMRWKLALRSNQSDLLSVISTCSWHTSSLTQHLRWQVFSTVLKQAHLKHQKFPRMICYYPLYCRFSWDTQRRKTHHRQKWCWFYSLLTFTAYSFPVWRLTAPWTLACAPSPSSSSVSLYKSAKEIQKKGHIHQSEFWKRKLLWWITSRQALYLISIPQIYVILKQTCQS